MSLRNLDSLFRPKSIAFICAPREPGRIGNADAPGDLRHGDLAGPVLPVTNRFEFQAGVQV